MLWSAAAAVFIGTLIAFAPALAGEFLDFDDHGFIKEVDGWRGLETQNLVWMFTTMHLGHYQPLTWLSYAIDHAFWGMNPRGYHWSNNLLHAFSAVMLMVITLRLMRAARGDTTGSSTVPELLGATFAALLFAIHPLRVESVAWITERRDVLSVAFLMCTVYAYLRAFPLKSAEKTSSAWYVASIVLLLASLFSKPWAMSFFVVALMLDWYPLRRLPYEPWKWFAGDARSVLFQKTPYILMGIFFAYTAGLAQKSTPYTMRSLEEWGISDRIAQVAYSMFFYVQKTLIPTSLSPLYELPVTLRWSEPRVIAAFAFAALAVGVLIWLFARRKAPAVLVAAGVYVVMVAPVSGIVQSGVQLVADRYSYVACMGLAVLAGWGLTWAWAQRRLAGAALKPVLGLVAVGLVALLAYQSWTYSHAWRTTRALWEHAVVAADGPMIREFYGRNLEVSGERERALEQYRISAQMNPAYGQAWLAQGLLLRDMGRYAEAEGPMLESTTKMQGVWRAHLALGVLYINRLNRPADAIRQLHLAVDDVEKNADISFSPMPYLVLGAAYGESGNLVEARRWLEKALDYPETKPQALEHLRDMGVVR